MWRISLLPPSAAFHEIFKKESETKSLKLNSTGQRGFELSVCTISVTGLVAGGYGTCMPAKGIDVGA